jgi:hypothetical protein
MVLWEAQESLSKMLTKVNSQWPNPRRVIALHSPDALLETGLRMCPAEKSWRSDPVLNRAVRSLQSGLFRNYRDKWAYFAYFWGNGGGISLQLRLAGGESGIRTHVTLSSKHAFQACAFSHSATSPSGTGGKTIALRTAITPRGITFHSHPTRARIHSMVVG